MAARARRQAQTVTGRSQVPDTRKPTESTDLTNNVGDALTAALVKASDEHRTDVKVPVSGTQSLSWLDYLGSLTGPLDERWNA